jgi:hypothetical protein
MQHTALRCCAQAAESVDVNEWNMTCPDPKGLAAALDCLAFCGLQASTGALPSPACTQQCEEMLYVHLLYEGRAYASRGLQTPVYMVCTCMYAAICEVVLQSLTAAYANITADDSLYKKYMLHAITKIKN